MGPDHIRKILRPHPGAASWTRGRPCPLRHSLHPTPANLPAPLLAPGPPGRVQPPRPPHGLLCAAAQPACQRGSANPLPLRIPCPPDFRPGSAAPDLPQTLSALLAAQSHLWPPSHTLKRIRECGGGEPLITLARGGAPKARLGRGESKQRESLKTVRWGKESAHEERFPVGKPVSFQGFWHHWFPPGVAPEGRRGAQKGALGQALQSRGKGRGVASLAPPRALKVGRGKRDRGVAAEDPNAAARLPAAMALLRGVFIVAAKRTPFGAYGGLLKDFTPTDMAEFAARAALSAGRVSPETVDSVVVGNVMQSSSDAIYLARHVGLRVGIPKETPAITINRLCGSGFQSIVSGCQEICSRDSEVVLCGGTESMSQAPYCVRNIRFGTKLGSELKLEDTLWTGLTDTHVQMPMAITAENLAVKHQISREDCDRYALQSQQRWKTANDAGYFDNEMAPVEVKTRKGKQTMQVDEHPRPQTTMEQLNKLPPVFKKEGTVTAGNASGVSDGAGAVIIASEDAVKKHNFTPLARIVGYFVSGCDPTIMGIGPVPAISGALKKTGLSLKDMDLVEVNEAFAPQYLAVEKSLNLDPSKTNVNGGAIALGHPLAGSGSRITAHLVHELRRRGGKYAVGSACIGGGQGIAVIIENTA
ncbi:3-ketoacyl-CoA thiolase, mitochondrial [Bos javanicus]|uniref:3-ketoacyl-CoA thiolase, mitochondrial n=1 Tax=Bos javanicus TaxID=9906 RepID=UPI002AA72BC3|nr:3-ketoacyl-CoA thiolase, mitochondrial [Bos javanicus]